MNAFAEVTAGRARAVSRRLPSPVDLLALYAQLSDKGRRPDTMMFQTIAGSSIILDQAAVRIEGRAGTVTLDALTAGGKTVLHLLGRRLEDQVTQCCAHRLIVRYERSRDVDAKRRLLAPSPFDVLRAIKSLFPSETDEEPFTVCLIGVIGFDHVDLFEELPQSAEDLVDFPDFIFWLAECAIVREPRLTPRLVCTSFSSGSGESDKRKHFSRDDLPSGPPRR